MLCWGGPCSFYIKDPFGKHTFIFSLFVFLLFCTAYVYRYSLQQSNFKQRNFQKLIFMKSIKYLTLVEVYILTMLNTVGVTRHAGTANAGEFIIVFTGVRVARSLPFYVVFWRSLFALLAIMSSILIWLPVSDNNFVSAIFSNIWQGFARTFDMIICEI